MRRNRLLAVRNSTLAFLVFAVLWGFNAPLSAQFAAGDSDDDRIIVSSRTAELLEILARSDAQSEAPILALEALDADNRLSLDAREQIMHDLAAQLRERSASAAGRRALQWLSDYESRVWIPYEGRGPANIPKWRVAGVARGTLALWDRAAAVAGAQRQLRAGTMDLADEVAKAESARDSSALAQVLRSASPDQLLANRDSLLEVMERDDAMAPAVAEAALRLQDAATRYLRPVTAEPRPG